MAKSTRNQGAAGKRPARGGKPKPAQSKSVARGAIRGRSTPTPKPARAAKPAPAPAAKAKATAKPKPAAPPAEARRPVATAPITPSRPSAVAVRGMNANPPAVVPSAVPTGGKPVKNQAGLSPRELEFFRDLLLAKRRELVGDMSAMEREALRSSGGTNLSTLPMHMADMGTDNYEQEFTLGLVEKDRNLVREINAALAKIQNGTYGICEATGKPIGRPRLEAQPWARFSIEYARQMEKGRRAI